MPTPAAADPESIKRADRLLANSCQVYGPARMNHAVVLWLKKHRPEAFDGLSDRRMPKLIERALIRYPDDVIRALHDELNTPPVPTTGT